MASDCGECSLCCKLMEIIELSKPRGPWCSHIAKDKHSCTIYADRPEGCREWECGWLSSQRSSEPLPPEMRPDRSHVVISRGAQSVWFHIDPPYSDALKGEGNKMGELLNKLIHKGIRVYATVGDKRIVYRKGMQPIYFIEKEPLPMVKDDPEEP